MMGVFTAQDGFQGESMDTDTIDAREMEALSKFSLILSFHIPTRV